MEFVHLVGAEQVGHAASTMLNAAREIRGAADSIAFSLEQQRRFMDDWLLRLMDVLEKARATPGGA